MILRVHKETEVRLPRKKMRELFEIIIDEEAEPDGLGTINVIFADDMLLSSLNRQYRQINHPTDVLSFNLDKTSANEDIFGEIYISVETAKRQSQEHSLQRELLRLMCHGMLHLFGFDHSHDVYDGPMKEREDRYLSKVLEVVK